MNREVQLIDLGAASLETKGPIGPFIEDILTLMLSPGLTAD